MLQLHWGFAHINVQKCRRCCLIGVVAQYCKQTENMTIWLSIMQCCQWYYNAHGCRFESYPNHILQLFLLDTQIMQDIKWLTEVWNSNFTRFTANLQKSAINDSPGYNASVNIRCCMYTYAGSLNYVSIFISVNTSKTRSGHCLTFACRAPFDTVQKHSKCPKTSTSLSQEFQQVWTTLIFHHECIYPGYFFGTSYYFLLFLITGYFNVPTCTKQ